MSRCEPLTWHTESGSAGHVKAAGVRLEADVMARIDEILGPVTERNPDLVESFKQRP